MLIHLMLNLLLKTAPGKSSALKTAKAISVTKNTQRTSWLFKNMILLQMCDKDCLIMIHTEIYFILQDV